MPVIPSDPAARLCTLAFLAALAFAPAGVRAAGPPVTEQEANELAKRVEAAAAKGDGTVLDKAFDIDALSNKVTAGMSVPANMAAGFTAGLKEKGFGSIIVSQLGPGGAYNFLRARGTPTDRTMLFRMAGQNGLNYHEYHLARDAAGAVRVVDVDVFATGEPFSQTLRRLFLPVVAKAKQGGMKLAAREADLVKHMAQVQQLNQLTLGNQPVEALKVYDALPTSLRNEKVLMIQRLMNAGKVDQALYQRAIADFEKQFPNDPGGLLVRLDGQFLAKDWPGLAKSVNALDKQVGTDPYLNLYRGNALVAQGKSADGKKLLADLVKRYPKIGGPYFALLDVTVAEKDHAETARLLTQAEQTLGVDFGGAATEPAFADFIASPQGKQWLAARQKPGQAAE